MNDDPMVFVQGLVGTFPELEPLLHEMTHNDSGQPDPELFFSSLTRWLIEQFMNHHNGSAHPGVQAIIDYMEDAFLEGGDSVRELIAFSVLLHMPVGAEPGSDIEVLLGPALTDAFDRVRRV